MYSATAADQEIAKQRAEIKRGLKTTWVGKGDHKKKVIAASHENTAAIFDQDPDLKHLGTNTMGGRMSWRELPSWRPDGSTFRAVNDHDLAQIESVLNWYFGGQHSSLSRRAIDSAIALKAGSELFSPLRDYLDALPAWDGVKRIGDAIPTAKGAGTPYVTQTLENFFLSLAQRAYEPGCQVDSMIVLVGGQGCKKTSFFKAIPPADLPVAELSTVPDDDRGKDALSKAHHAPIALIDEIDKLNRKHDQAAIKASLTSREDTWRAPYARTDQTQRRQFVFAGTTNEEEFLLDVTGNRRYWVVVVESPIPDEFLTREHMDLLLAEARDRYRAGERLDYGSEYEALADSAREAHLDDPIRAAVYEWLTDPEGENGQYPSIDKISVEMLLRHVPALDGINSVAIKDKLAVKKVRAAMDAHPDYQRYTDGDGRLRVDGRQARVAWVRRDTAPAVEARLSEAQEALLLISDAARRSPLSLDPRVFPATLLASVWYRDRRFDERHAEVIRLLPYDFTSAIAAAGVDPRAEALHAVLGLELPSADPGIPPAPSTGKKAS